MELVGDRITFPPLPLLGGYGFLVQCILSACHSPLCLLLLVKELISILIYLLVTVDIPARVGHVDAFNPFEPFRQTANIRQDLYYTWELCICIPSR